MRIEVLLLILGMAAVTYIPRALPAVLIEKMKFGSRMEKFLQLIPYTAMAALIFPGIWSVDTAHPAVSLVGGLVAAILAWVKLPVMVCVLGAIGIDLVLYAFVL